MRTAVADAAIEIGLRGQPLDLVLNAQMALHAFDLVFRNMHPVQQFGIVVLVQAFGFEMAGAAVIERDESVSFDCLIVAVGTVNLSGDLVGMVIPKMSPFFRRNGAPVVAGLALAEPTFLGGELDVARRFEVTQETGRFRDHDVIALYDLGMAARAAQLFASSEFPKVRFVVEHDAFEGYRA